VSQLRLQRENLISIWHDVNSSPGAEWEREISTHLNTAEIILLLICPDFMASDYCYSVEMQRAMERHERGEACVIPMLKAFLRRTGVRTHEALQEALGQALLTVTAQDDQDWFGHGGYLPPQEKKR